MTLDSRRQRRATCALSPTKNKTQRRRCARIGLTPFISPHQLCPPLFTHTLHAKPLTCPPLLFEDCARAHTHDAPLFFSLPGATCAPFAYISPIPPRSLRPQPPPCPFLTPPLFRLLPFARHCRAFHSALAHRWARQTLHAPLCGGPQTIHSLFSTPKIDIRAGTLQPRPCPSPYLAHRRCRQRAWRVWPLISSDHRTR